MLSFISGKLFLPINIAISGKMGHGKDTLAKMLYKELTHHIIFPPKIVSFGSKLKKFASYLTNVPLDVACLNSTKSMVLNYSKAPTFGILLQILGNAVREYVDENVWVKNLFDYIDQHMVKTQSIIISDLRYPNEYEECKKRGFIMIRIERELNVKSDTRDTDHISETALDMNYNWDFVFENNKTQEHLLYEVKDKIFDIIKLSQLRLH